MEIKFLRDEIFETEGPNKGPKFEKDSVHDLREDQAQRWINRGAAVPHDGKAVSAPEQVKKPDETPDFSKMKRDELDAYAAEHGIDIADAKNKDDVIAAIELALEAK
jgi:hypothetical protein